MSSPETLSQRCSRGVATPPIAGLVDSSRCLQCRRPLPRPRKGQKACSAKCRWALWQAQRQAGRLARAPDLLAALDQAEALHQRSAEILQAVRRRLGEEA
jgi:hypothetical protein